MAFGWLINDHDCDQTENQSSVSMKNASATKMENAKQKRSVQKLYSQLFYMKDGKEEKQQQQLKQSSKLTLNKLKRVFWSKMHSE